MNLVSVFEVNCESDRYLGWSEPKASYCQSTEGALPTQPKIYLLEYVILNCYSYSNCSCCFSNNGEFLVWHLYKVCILVFSKDLTLLGKKYRLHYKYTSFRELQCCVLRHEHRKLKQWVLARLVFLKSCCSVLWLQKRDICLAAILC